MPATVCGTQQLEHAPLCSLGCSTASPLAYLYVARYEDAFLAILLTHALVIWRTNVQSAARAGVVFTRYPSTYRISTYQRAFSRCMMATSAD